MTNQNCKKCGVKKGYWETKAYCFDCESKREFNIAITLFAVAIMVIVGVRVLYAHFIYHDVRCVLAECRIVK